MFTTSKSPKSQKLAEKSSKILDVFSKTKADLLAVNQEIEAEEASVADQIVSLNSQLTDLAIAKEQNSKVVANINKIFE